MKDHLADHTQGSELPPELQVRLQTCPESERMALKKTWHLARLGIETADEATPDLNALWMRLAPALAQPAATPLLDRPPEVPRRARRQKRRAVWPGILAAGVLIGALGLALWLQPTTRTAPLGGRLLVLLPDGSQVNLNSGARLTYQRPFFGWNRTLRLEGEAFFDVVTERQPFIVETFNAAVTVLGTRFNVRAWPEERAAETVVVLASGSVTLAALQAPGPPLRLEPGQMSRLPRGTTEPLTPQAVSVERLLAWRTGGFAFDDHPLHTILQEIERRYGVAVTASPPLLDEKLVLFLDAQSDVEAVLDVLCNFLGCRYEATEEGYQLLEIDPM